MKLHRINSMIEDLMPHMEDLSWGKDRFSLLDELVHINVTSRMFKAYLNERNMWTGIHYKVANKVQERYQNSLNT
jgi:hypothetical protein